MLFRSAPSPLQVDEGSHPVPALPSALVRAADAPPRAPSRGVGVGATRGRRIRGVGVRRGGARGGIVGVGVRGGRSWRSRGGRGVGVLGWRSRGGRGAGARGGEEARLDNVRIVSVTTALLVCTTLLRPRVSFDPFLGNRRRDVAHQALIKGVIEGDDSTTAGSTACERSA